MAVGGKTGAGDTLKAQHATHHLIVTFSWHEKSDEPLTQHMCALIGLISIVIKQKYPTYNS